jgi:type VI secretion system protein ImpA
MSGLASGTALTSRLLAEYWDSVYPQLDPDDNNDPTERVNALLNLCDRDSLLTPLRTAPLVSSRTFGVISLRDVEIAKGESSETADAEGELPDLSTIDAAFLDCDFDQLRRNADAVSGALGNIKGIEATVTDRVGASQAPDLGPIRHLLSAVDALLKAKVAERAEAEGVEPSASADDESQAPAESGASPTAAPAEHSGSAINSRNDVVKILDKLCDYYARNEPSSPVPLLLQRARSLVTKDFMGVVQDLAPEAVAQIEAIRGPQGGD